LALRPNAGHGLLILEVSSSHTTTHHSRQDSSGRVISSSQRPLPDNTQHSQQRNIYASSGIRTHDLSRRAAADLHLRPRGHWDRLFLNYAPCKSLEENGRLIFTIIYYCGNCSNRYSRFSCNVRHIFVLLAVSQETVVTYEISRKSLEWKSICSVRTDKHDEIASCFSPL
jgi:hypothetical protein